MKRCNASECERPYGSGGFCWAHYNQLRAGKKLGRVKSELTVEERFDEHIDKSGECWEWKLKLTPGGYGRFFVSSDRRGVPAHRVSYEMNVGPIPDGLVVDHICFNRSCVNPDHLQLLTRGENASRTLSKTLPYCKNMHIRTAENTHHYTDPKGEAKRRCRDCASERAREAYHRRKNIEES